MFKTQVKMRRQVLPILAYNVANVFNPTRFFLVGDLEHFLPIFHYELTAANPMVSTFQEKFLHF
jgi:hypothetical protein